MCVLLCVSNDVSTCWMFFWLMTVAGPWFMPTFRALVLLCLDKLLMPGSGSWTTRTWVSTCKSPLSAVCALQQCRQCSHPGVHASEVSQDPVPLRRYVELSDWRHFCCLGADGWQRRQWRKPVHETVQEISTMGRPLCPSVRHPHMSSSHTWRREGAAAPWHVNMPTRLSLRQHGLRKWLLPQQQLQQLGYFCC